MTQQQAPSGSILCVLLPAEMAPGPTQKLVKHLLPELSNLILESAAKAPSTVQGNAKTLHSPGC